jgi:hypothetical protein
MSKDFHAWSYSLKTHKGKYYFENYFAEVLYPGFTTFKPHSKPIVTPNRIRARHYRLKAFLRRLNVVSDAMDDYEKATETHITTSYGNATDLKRRVKTYAETCLRARHIPIQDRTLPQRHRLR